MQDLQLNTTFHLEVLELIVILTDGSDSLRKSES